MEGKQVCATAGCPIGITSSSEGFAWDVGVSYEFGPWAFGVTYFHGQQEGLLSDPEQDELDTVSGGVSYALGPGITARAGVMWADWKPENGELQSGVAGAVGLSFSFLIHATAIGYMNGGCLHPPFSFARLVFSRLGFSQSLAKVPRCWNETWSGGLPRCGRGSPRRRSRPDAANLKTSASLPYPRCTTKRPCVPFSRPGSPSSARTGCRRRRASSPRCAPTA